MKNVIALAMLVSLCGFGCHTKPSTKPKLTRGWIGGEFATATRGLIPNGQKYRVYVKQVFSETPAAQAGMQPGDLITRFDSEPVFTLKQFRQHIDAATPGDQATLQVYRDGKPLDVPLTIGRETYQDWHSFRVGLGLTTSFDMCPNPDFNVLPVGFYRRHTTRTELRSADTVLYRQTWDTPLEESGFYSEEGWNAWFLIFGFSHYKAIMAQESVAAR